MKKSLLYFCLLLLVYIPCAVTEAFGQSRKDIKKNGIKSLKVFITSPQNTATINESYVKFDSNGNIREESAFDDAGVFKKKEAYKYNENNDKTEEITYGKDGKQVSRSEYRYNAFGEKTEEIVYDENNALKSKHVYSYDKNGLKTEKKTYDAKGNLLSTKKYVYEY